MRSLTYHGASTLILVLSTVSAVTTSVSLARLLFAFFTLLFGQPTHRGLAQLEILPRSDVLEGKAFDEAGAYES